MDIGKRKDIEQFVEGALYMFVGLDATAHRDAVRSRRRTAYFARRHFTLVVTLPVTILETRVWE